MHQVAESATRIDYGHPISVDRQAHLHTSARQPWEDNEHPYLQTDAYDYDDAASFSNISSSNFVHALTPNIYSKYVFTVLVRGWLLVPGVHYHSCYYVICVIVCACTIAFPASSTHPLSR